MLMAITKAPKSKPKPVDEALVRRMNEVLDLRGLSRRAWSEKAGLSQSLVGQIMRGDLAGDSSFETFDALARVADVSTEWLARGRGQRGHYQAAPVVDPVDSRLDRYGNLAVVLEYWSKKDASRWSEATKAAARSIANHSREDPDANAWETRLDAIEELVSGAAQLASPIGSSKAPPRGARKS